jgi:multiple sugar transport system ATP-binding protein
MATVELEEITKVYANGFTAVRDLSLGVSDGEFMVLVGPSGCGKTTALRMVAGLEDISAGTLRIRGRVMNDASPKDRDIAMVFQNYALYPHMTVAENIGFALKLRKLPKAEIEAKVRSAADILGLTESLTHKPGQLSGGQRQRVAMGRALVREPAVFLMDEPLSNLDAKLRVQMRAEVLRIQRRLGVATLYVTHDQTEAMTMGDRVAVLNAGVLQQCEAPQVLYDRPVNLFVAAFMGSPAMNLYQGHLAPDGSSLKVGSQRIALPSELGAVRAGLAAHRGRAVVVGIRPEHLAIASTSAPADAVLSGDVELVEALGSELLVHFFLDAPGVDGDELASGVGAGQLSALGEESGRPGRPAMGVARVEPGVSVRVGQRLRLAVRTANLHFFDPQTGAAIWT